MNYDHNGDRSRLSVGTNNRHIANQYFNVTIIGKY
jgi:hypothetical protein